MRAVGVKELKAKLSEYLRLVRAGETVVVTDRDQVVAELRPAPRRAAPREQMDEVLDGLAEAGELARPALPKGHWTWKSEGLGLAPGTAQRLLDALRAER